MRRNLNSKKYTPIVETNSISSSDIASVNTDQKKMEGLEDAVKDSVKEDQKAKLKLEGLVNASTKTIFRTKTIFPDFIFPTEVIIDITKVTLIDHIFFFSKITHSVFIADITDVLVHNGIIWSTLEIVDAGFTENSIKINRLPRSDAQKARSIIQGLVITKKQDVDISKLSDLPTQELINKLEILGSAQG